MFLATASWRWRCVFAAMLLLMAGRRVRIQYNADGLDAADAMAADGGERGAAAAPNAVAAAGRDLAAEAKADVPLPHDGARPQSNPNPNPNPDGDGVSAVIVGADAVPAEEERAVARGEGNEDTAAGDGDGGGGGKHPDGPVAAIPSVNLNADVATHRRSMVSARTTADAKANTAGYTDGCVGDRDAADTPATKDPHLAAFAQNTRSMFHNWKDWTKGRKCEAKTEGSDGAVFFASRPTVRRRRNNKKHKKYMRQLMSVLSQTEVNTMKALCVSSKGGFYGHGLQRRFRLGLKSEDHQVFGLYIHPLPFMPKCYVDATLMVHLMTHHSSNLGHATSRVLGMRRAREFLGPPYDTSDMITLFAARSDFYRKNKGKHIYSPYLRLMSEYWISTNSSGSENASPGDVVCFKEAAFAMMVPDQWGKYGRREGFIRDKTVGWYPQDPTFPYQQAQHYANQMYNQFHEDYRSLRQDMRQCMGADNRAKASDTKDIRVTWVSRENASRHLVDERAQFTTLAKMFASNKTIRFTYAQLENMTVPEQVRLVSATDILIGPHGAGLTWLYLLPTGAVVVEIQGWFPKHGNNYLSCAPRGVNSGPYCPFGHITAILRGITHIVEHASPALPPDEKDVHLGNMDIPSERLLDTFRVALRLVKTDFSLNGTLPIVRFPRALKRYLIDDDEA